MSAGTTGTATEEKDVQMRNSDLDISQIIDDIFSGIIDMDEERISVWSQHRGYARIHQRASQSRN